jgi:two-component system chemotaxis response regulator CheB
MAIKYPYKAIVIGGSAGSFQTILHILESLPKHFSIPIIITLHRLKHVRSGLAESVSLTSHKPIVEPFDKQKIEQNTVYIAPSNYHLLVEDDYTFSLSTEQPVEFSRPSIDVLFASAAQVYKHELIAILLSGANKDGAQGMKIIKQLGGTLIIQDPSEAEVSIMPKSVIDIVRPDIIMETEDIITFLKNMVK